MTSVDTQDRSQCIFCQAYASAVDRATLTLWRRQRSFALLNRYPYTTGHCMVAPIKHCSDLESLEQATLTEMLLGTQALIRVLRMLYDPHGFNVGFNLGEAAGAGIEEHLHLHIVPRWRGDTSQMTVIGGVRVIPEDLETTMDRFLAEQARQEGTR